MLQHFPHYRIILSLLCAVLLVACTAETTCRKDMEVRAVVSLQADSLNIQGHAVKYNQWDSLSVEVMGKTEFFLDNAKALSKLSLPLRPDTTVSAFVMNFHEQIDTLYIQHTPRQYFVSIACGCAIYHTITAAWSTDHRVDSVEIINANVENAVQENLRIHLHE